MSDAFRLQFRGPRPVGRPDGLAEWNGYLLPVPGRTFHRDELRAIAEANGHPLSPALLYKWRLWRFLPGPTPGGPTGKGRGKGQTWPEGAGWRTAWLARWLADSLTYDALRLALWPWTRPFDEEKRIGDVVSSLRSFVAQDRDYHGRLAEVPSIVPETDAAAYVALMEGDTQSAVLEETVASLTVGSDDPRYLDIRLRISQLSFEALEQDLAKVDAASARSFIATFRDSLADRERTLTSIFWDSPLALARIVVRELFYWLDEVDRS